MKEDYRVHACPKDNHPMNAKCAVVQQGFSSAGDNGEIYRLAVHGTNIAADPTVRRRQLS
jgi:hypothetical protein